MKKDVWIIEAKMILGKRAKFFNIKRCVNLIAPNIISSKIILSRTGIITNREYSLYELECAVKQTHGLPKRLVITKLLGI